MEGLHSSDFYFPNPEEADENGLVAIGGDLEAGRLLKAYESGIFPWYEDPYPILWWSPDPRMILYPDEIRISDSLRRRLRNRKYKVRIDTEFVKVLHHCARSGQRSKQGTWITPEMINAYIRLHEMGLAHSFETYENGKLTGGLYGLSLGKSFFGESMFFFEPDASKVALVYLARLMEHMGFHFIDVQQETAHLKSMGAVTVSRKEFLLILKKSLSHETTKGNWSIFGCQNELLI